MPPHDSPASRLQLSVRRADVAVEMAAERVLRQCVMALGLPESPLPVPVDTWIERPLGYRFEILPAGEMEQGADGLARPSLGEIAINEDLLEHEGRFRFTCAHELGHLTLHRELEKAFWDQSLPAGPDAGAVEREADRFAAALLMPLETLGLAFERIRGEHGLVPSTVSMLRGDDTLAVWLWRRCYIPALSELYGVSRPAMVYRCREVRLAGGKRLLRPSMLELLLAPSHAVSALELDRIGLVDGVPCWRR